MCLTLRNPMDCSLPGSSAHEFSRSAYWSGLPFPSPGDLPNPGIEPKSPALQANSLLSEPPGKLSEVLSRKEVNHLHELKVNDKNVYHIFLRRFTFFTYVNTFHVMIS